MVRRFAQPPSQERLRGRGTSPSLACMTVSGPKDAHELAAHILGFQTSVVVVSLALPIMVDPRRPLIDYYAWLNSSTRAEAESMPVQLTRADGTARVDSVGAWLRRAADDQGRGLGLGEDLVAFATIYATTRIGDEVDRLQLRDETSPLMEFLRHLRNACAHGNRWYFTGTEPKNPAVWRHLTVEPAWHGQRAMYGTLGPAEYLDLLDDLAGRFRSLPA